MLTIIKIHNNKNDMKQKASKTRTESGLSNFSDSYKILVQLSVLTQDGREDTAVKNDFVRKLDFKTCICV